jgi:glycosyltransferase involved in cell wall biosynthesis
VIPLHVTILSSKERCGIQTYAQTLADALRALGHRVDLVGIGWWDSAALRREVARIPASSTHVIVEHEFAIYRTVPLALAMLRLRLRGKRVLLSMHELEPEKFLMYHKIVAVLHYRMRGSALFELLRVAYSGLLIAARMLRYRSALWLLGAFPDRIVVHSPRALANITLVTGDAARVATIPHFVEPLPGMPEPPEDDSALKRELRERLGLPQDRSIYVSPGFLFRRKRLVEVIAAAPRDALVVIAGTESPHERAGYLDELRRSAAEHGRENVRIDTDYDAMPLHLMAADAVVLFYSEGFQSGIASHAIWAEKPCVFSDDEAFDMYDGAGLRAGDAAQLRAAMREVRKPEVALRLRERARELKAELSPEKVAQRYVEALG